MHEGFLPFGCCIAREAVAEHLCCNQGTRTTIVTVCATSKLSLLLSLLYTCQPRLLSPLYVTILPASLPYGSRCLRHKSLLQPTQPQTAKVQRTTGSGAQAMQCSAACRGQAHGTCHAHVSRSSTVLRVASGRTYT